MKVVAGRFAEHIGKRLSSDYNLEVLFTGKNKDGGRYFPDGEPYISLPDEKKLKDEQIVILTSGHPRPTVGLFELEELIKIAEDNKASEIDLFYLYFPFGMQDKEFSKGERNIAKDICEKCGSENICRRNIKPPAVQEHGRRDPSSPMYWKRGKSNDEISKVISGEKTPY